ncbi:hypothetical protein HY624_02340 [Candidatus Uhrbacteria bacterium]|nr:hypothetical protein [Candidatus Uhrbacteria bacterium]
MPLPSLPAIQKRLEHVRWYKQGGAVKPLTVSYPGRACLGFTMHGKKTRFNYTPFGWYLKGDYFDVYFPRDGMHRIAQWYYHEELRRPEFIVNLKRQWEQRTKLFFSQIRAIEHTDLRLLATKDLLSLFHIFSKSMDALWREAIFLDAFDVSGEEILENERTRAGVTLSNSELALLTAPVVLSTLQRERQELFALAAGRKKPDDARLRHHADKYHWIYNDYAVIKRLDGNFFLRAIRSLRRHPKKWREEAATIAMVGRNAEAKRRLIRVKRLPSRFVHICHLLATLASWRDLRKSMNQQGNATVQLFACEFARRSGLALREVEYCWWWEIRDLLTRTHELKRLAHARMKGLLIFGYRAKNYFYYGNDGRRFHQYLESCIAVGDTIQGRSAYPGVVRGAAKIILTQNDFKKMKRGDILVAPNTRPEYVPIMKIASAIVSEEGGLTCHSAIVARELKIPAVVGAQGAITSLKDGDRIEVDAVHGVVKKI